MKSFYSTVIGLDIGGTSTRGVLSTRDHVVATSSGPGSNPVSMGYETAIATWESVIRELLLEARVSLSSSPVVEHFVIGGAGVGTLDVDDIVARLRATSGSVREPVFTSDVAIAFASSTSSPEGLVIVSGTGAVAGRMRDYDLVEFVDGNGWLVGDAGSGHWIGVEAARAVLATFQFGPPTTLREVILPIGRLEEKWSSVLRWIYDLPPRGLAALVPHVRDAALAGDLVASDILDRAADELVSSLARVLPSADDGIVVLGGSIARSPDMLFERLRSRISQRWELDVMQGGNGAIGATKLAWRAVDQREP